MLGLFLAAAYVGYKYMTLGGTSLEPAFLGAASFLYSWYWSWTIVGGIFVAVIALIALIGGSVAGSSRGGVLGGVGGLVLGGGFSAIIAALFAARQALLIIGAYLLMTSGSVGQKFAEFDTQKIIVGSVLLVIALFFCRSSGRSSK